MPRRGPGEAARAPGAVGGGQGGRKKLGWEHSGKTLNRVLDLFVCLFVCLFIKGLSIFCKRPRNQTHNLKSTPHSFVGWGGREYVGGTCESSGSSLGELGPRRHPGSGLCPDLLFL